MSIDDKRTKNEAMIRELFDDLVAAIRAKNLDGVMACYATDLVAFDIVPPLQFVGASAYRKPWQDVFERFQTLDYEVRDLSIVAGDDVGFSYSLNRIHGTMTNGEKTDLWLRLTACYRKIDGRWRIAHLQASVPADLATGKAVLDLKP
ncbi:MAG TPA: nuclear transport factor 2 family protein [Kofleriaceae bacterium]|nr:nuclear transport factor 2 family protein [Kofleriaceae bacterium]